MALSRRYFNTSAPKRRPAKMTTRRAVAGCTVLRTWHRCPGRKPKISSPAIPWHPSQEPTPFGKRRDVTRTVNDADDHDRLSPHQIVDRVWPMKRHAQSRRELVPSWLRQRKMPQRLKARLDRTDKPRSDRLRRFGRKRDPDFGEIGLRRLGQTERERAANSFLPRSTIRALSKSSTRPSARSVSPRSMSALSAASS